MKIRNRIKEYRLVPSSELRPNPRNWRSHPDSQANALKGVLSEIGIAGAALARELEDGSLMLIDGHLRVETLTDEPVPVLILDVDAEEADKLLLTHDTITVLAETDEARLSELMKTTEFASKAVLEMLDRFSPPANYGSDPHLEIPELYQVVITCRDENHQEELYERLTDEGLKCRLMNL